MKYQHCEIRRSIFLNNFAVSLTTLPCVCVVYVLIFFSYRPVFGIYQVKLNPCPDRSVDQHLISPCQDLALFYYEVK